MKAIYEAPSIEVLMLETESAMLARQSLYPTKQTTDPTNAAMLTVEAWDDITLPPIDIELKADYEL